MIKTARQLKDKVKNLSGSDSRKAQIYLRNYFMERFLERVSISQYNDKFVLKGGMLVASLVGLQMRATMDIDTTIRNITVNIMEAEKIVSDIIAVELDDNVTFSISSFGEIMEEHDYPGIRFILEAKLDTIKQPVKIDISTGDVITPAAVSYSYQLMFEDRSIPIYTYNVETLLAEKLETMMARGIANTRLRDFYDVYTIIDSSKDKIDVDNLRRAFIATSEKRNTSSLIDDIHSVMTDIRSNDDMRKLWERYSSKNFYVGELMWNDVLDVIDDIFRDMFITADIK